MSHWRCDSLILSVIDAQLPCSCPAVDLSLLHIVQKTQLNLVVKHLCDVPPSQKSDAIFYFHNSPDFFKPSCSFILPFSAARNLNQGFDFDICIHAIKSTHSHKITPWWSPSAESSEQLKPLCFRASLNKSET